jgi:parvulin-like peptidyl-prolyl isomerase
MSLIINGEPIPAELLEQEFEGIKAHYERMGAMSCCSRNEEFRGYARENVIARVLINQEAERRFPAITPDEISEALDKLIEAEGGRAAFFAHAGLTEADEPMVLQEVASGLRVDRLMMETWGPESPPSPAAARDYYESHLTDYLSTEEVRAFHLFKQVEKVEDRETVYEKMRQWRREARAEGGDFAAIALANTDKEDKQVDLGFFRRGEFMEEFDLIVFSLEEGEVSPVFASHWGFHLVQLASRRAPVPHPFESVRDDLDARLLAEHRSLTTRALVERLKTSAEVIDGS